MMKVSVIFPEDVDETIRKSWREIQADNEHLANPYFSIDYVESVAAVRNDVRIGIMEEEGRVIGYFPFQCERDGVATPVGGRMCDYQGVIVSSRQQWSTTELLKGCGLDVWEFDSLPRAQCHFSPHYKRMSFSPRMNLSQGYEHYEKLVREFGGKKIIKTMRLWRKFEREIGALQFEVYSNDQDSFNQLVEWKREQCVSIGEEDFLSWSWTTGMLEQIVHKRNQHFNGMLSVLRVDNEIVAAQIGMHTTTVCHGWFTAYNHKFSKYSPGSLLLVKMAQELPALGIEWIDLSKGKEGYKASFATDRVDVVEGCELLPSLSTGKYIMRKGMSSLRKDVWWPAKNRLSDMAQNYRK